MQKLFAFYYQIRTDVINNCLFLGFICEDDAQYREGYQ